MVARVPSAHTHASRPMCCLIRGARLCGAGVHQAESGARSARQAREAVHRNHRGARGGEREFQGRALDL
eukprot:5176172-Prymnesium_polylepis.2